MIVINLSSFRFRRGRRWGLHCSLFANIANTDLFHFVKSLAAVSFKHFDFELTKTSCMEQLELLNFAHRKSGVLNCIMYGRSRTDMSNKIIEEQAGIKKQNSKKGQEILKLQ